MTDLRAVYANASAVSGAVDQHANKMARVMLRAVEGELFRDGLSAAHSAEQEYAALAAGAKAARDACFAGGSYGSISRIIGAGIADMKKALQTT